MAYLNIQSVSATVCSYDRSICVPLTIPHKTLVLSSQVPTHSQTVGIASCRGVHQNMPGMEIVSTSTHWLTVSQPRGREGRKGGRGTGEDKLRGIGGAESEQGKDG